MNKKRILICDDNFNQFSNLEDKLKDYFDIRRSKDYRTIIDDLEANKPVQMLILDLGFSVEADAEEQNYIGHNCIPDVIEYDENIKIIVYSDILTYADDERVNEALKISRELIKYQNVKAFLSPMDGKVRVQYEVNKALGTSKWLSDGEVWLLHLSDLQFGGEGLILSVESLLEKIDEALVDFMQGEGVNNEPKGRKYPSIALITGDLSQHGRPVEFKKVSHFIKKLSHLLSQRRSDLRGAFGDRSNVIIIPGNHDINLDILRGQNIYKNSKNGKIVEYRDGKENIRSELEYLWEYSWYPFCNIGYGLPLRNKNWCWDPGYEIINLKNELGLIFVALNSSRWSVNHIKSTGLIPEDIFLSIQSQLKKIDAAHDATRILLTHHSLYGYALPKNRLSLLGKENEYEQLINLVSKTCGFSVIMSGHIHKRDFRNIDTNDENRKLIHIGADTIFSNNRPEFRNPGFNIIRLLDLPLDGSRFRKLIVYTFSWNGNMFTMQAPVTNSAKIFRLFDLT